ncbi:MAG: GNAT family N-acetyltransferase [Bacteroidota bacterium]
MIWVETTALSELQKEEIRILWNLEYPVHFGHASLADFETYLQNLSNPTHVLIIDDTQKIRAWYCHFTRENEKWFAMILDSTLQGQGFGSRLLERAKSREEELHGWVVENNIQKKRNGEFYKSPLQFYLKNGFKIVEGSSLELKKTPVFKIKWKKI